MQDGSIRDELLRNSGPFETDVRAGPAVEGEAALAAVVDCDDRQGGRDGLVDDEAGGVDVVVLEGAPQQAAEGVVADAADEGGLRPETGRGHRHVGGRATGVGGQGRDASLVDAGLGEVDEYFSDRNDVNGSFSVRHGSLSFWQPRCPLRRTDFCNRFHYNSNIRVSGTNRNEKPLGETPKKIDFPLCKMPSKMKRASRVTAGSQ